jgi:hypothetical protein
MKFNATIELGGKTATGITVPEEVATSFNSGKRFPVSVSINGYTYRTTLTFYGGRFVVPLSAEHREAAGVSAGEDVEVTIELDSAPRDVELPADLAVALEPHPEAQAFFASLAPSHKKEYVRWIEEAKREETRRDRVAKTTGLLREGKKQR